MVFSRSCITQANLQVQLIVGSFGSKKFLHIYVIIIVKWNVCWKRKLRKDMSQNGVLLGCDFAFSTHIQYLCEDVRFRSEEDQRYGRKLSALNK